MPNLQIYKIVKEWDEKDAEAKINDLALQGYEVLKILPSSNYIVVLMGRQYDDGDFIPELKDIQSIKKEE